MDKAKITLAAIIIIGALLRLCYAFNLPLNGDEAGIGMLQASGQAATYAESLPKGIFPIESIKRLVAYSKDFSVKDVLISLRADGGMHPPLYYIALHYVLKYPGNNVLMLRSISIIISLLSVLFLYTLGEIIYDKTVGLYAASFLSFSAYGVMYGSMVRPYPLAMLLGLISTVLVCRLAEGVDNKKLFLYILTALAGIYTIYHFILVIFFQIVMIAIYNRRKSKNLFVIGAVIASLFVLYLPWAPSFLEQFKNITGGNFYFHGQVHFLSFLHNLADSNFTRFLPYGSAMLMGSLIFLTVSLGCCGLAKKKKSGFVLALALYLLAYYAADRALRMHTLQEEKLYFFIMPLFFLLFAAGLRNIPKRFALKTVSLSLCYGLLLLYSIPVCFYRPELDTPHYLNAYCGKMSDFLRKGAGKSLIVVNTDDRRYLIPLALALKDPLDMQVVHKAGVASEMPAATRLKDYDYVFFLNFFMFYNPDEFFSSKEVDSVRTHLRSCGFVPAEPPKIRYKPSISMFAVFKRAK